MYNLDVDCVFEAITLVRANIDLGFEPGQDFGNCRERKTRKEKGIHVSWLLVISIRGLVNYYFLIDSKVTCNLVSKHILKQLAVFVKFLAVYHSRIVLKRFPELWRK